MARLAVLTSPDASDNDDDIQNDNRRVVNPASLSPSPAASFSSDKENRAVNQPARNSNGKTTAMPPPSKIPTPNSAEPEANRASKRRRLSERDAPNAPDASFAAEADMPGNSTVYDPDQNIDERRAIRKDYRDLSKELTGELLTILYLANDLFGNIKQTSDATLDSRLLVSTADLSVKRTQQLNIGDSTPGIDVNDFIGKCINFMRKGEAGSRGSGSTQRQRRRDRDDQDSAEEGSADEGDALNWEWLGCQACFPNNLRPPVPGFLLGPLSVQKRVRKQTQRRERLQKRDPRDAVRPEEVKANAIEKAESSNLTFLCRQIRALLNQTQTRGYEMARKEFTDEMTQDEQDQLLAKHLISEDRGVPFFRFVINPKSFGQTVENMFYVSFLIKEGAVGIRFDADDLPTLHVTKTGEERKQGEQDQEDQEDQEDQQIEDVPQERHQAVFHLDFEVWDDLIDAFDIKDSIIPHRRTGEEVQLGATGWYG